MFFGVYFVFATVAEALTAQLDRMKKLVKKEFSETNMNINEVHRSHRMTFTALIVATLVCLFVGAAVLMQLEGWSFVTAVYFCVETMTVRSHHYYMQNKPHTPSVLLAFISTFLIIGC